MVNLFPTAGTTNPMMQPHSPIMTDEIKWYPDFSIHLFYKTHTIRLVNKHVFNLFTNRLIAVSAAAN